MIIPKIYKNFLYIEHNIDSEISQTISQTPNKNKIYDSEYEEIKRKMIAMNNIKTPFYNYFFYSPIKRKNKNKNNKNHLKKILQQILN
jgi:hypothetical protein